MTADDHPTPKSLRGKIGPRAQKTNILNEAIYTRRSNAASDDGAEFKRWRHSNKSPPNGNPYARIKPTAARTYALGKTAERCGLHALTNSEIARDVRGIRKAATASEEHHQQQEIARMLRLHSSPRRFRGSSNARGKKKVAKKRKKVTLEALVEHTDRDKDRADETMDDYETCRRNAKAAEDAYVRLYAPSAERKRHADRLQILDAMAQEMLVRSVARLAPAICSQMPSKSLEMSGGDSMPLQKRAEADALMMERWARF